jgi:hypothetical protein
MLNLQIGFEDEFNGGALSVAFIFESHMLASWTRKHSDHFLKILSDNFIADFQSGQRRRATDANILQGNGRSLPLHPNTRHGVVFFVSEVQSIGRKP